MHERCSNPCDQLAAVSTRRKASCRKLVWVGAPRYYLNLLCTRAAPTLVDESANVMARDHSEGVATFLKPIIHCAVQQAVSLLFS